MSVITFQRKHGKSESDARAAAENMALQLQKEFDLEYVWDGEVMQFKRPGVSGELTLDKQNVILTIRLGLFLSALRPRIEREVHRFLDENFQA